MPGNEESFGRRRATTVSIVLAGIAALIAVAGAGSAHASEEHGEITLHDGPDEPPTTQLHCNFWVKGDGMTHEDGVIEALQTRETEEIEHRVGFWNVSRNGSTDAFTAGPFTLPSGWGNYSFRAAVNGSDHATAWSEEIGYNVCDDEGGPPSCPKNVKAEAKENGEIELSWGSVEEADSYKIYRSGEGAAFSKFASTRDPGFVDRATEVEQSYRYRVVAANEAGESQQCPIVEATAIPFFPATGTAGYAAVAFLGTLAAVHLGRRRS